MKGGLRFGTSVAQGVPRMTRPPPRAAPQATPTWREFAGGADAPLARLLREQEGDLAGPRPQRGPAGSAGEGEGEGEGGAAGIPAGGIISGRDLLRLLQDMQGINVTSPG